MCVCEVHFCACNFGIIVVLPTGYFAVSVCEWVDYGLSIRDMWRNDYDILYIMRNFPGSKS